MTDQLGARSREVQGSSPRAPARSAPAGVAARDQAEGQVRTTVARRRPGARLGDEVAQRVEPVVGQVQAQLGDLPERVVQVIEPVAGNASRELTRLTTAPDSSETDRARRRQYIPGVLATLAGGVGAARFLAGLVRVVPPAESSRSSTPADDDEFHGLYVSPDLDSVTYTLAGASNAAQGWGLEGETFATLDALDRYDVPTWFRLGDNDIATHLFRTRAPARGRAALGGDRARSRAPGSSTCACSR